MFGIGIPELILILAVALIVIGPDKLPEVAKTLGKAFFELKKVVDGVKTSIDEEVKSEEKKPDERPHKQTLQEKEEELMKDYEEAEAPEDETVKKAGN